jgi:hypothetical protein
LAGAWRIAGFEELRELGAGGQGRVVLARHEESGTPVAIKYVRADAAQKELLRHEAVLLGRVHDPHVARLYRLVESEHGAAIVMEAIDGVSLKKVLEHRGALEPEAALLVMKGSLLGLAAAHRVGVVHRDYKPANVVVRADGLSKLIDFGIAVLAGEGGASGTPRYMAPEQWRGEPAVPATDVYAATCVFFECLTGRRPFRGDREAALREAHLSAPPPVEEAPEHVRGLIARGMAKSAEERPGDAAGFVQELETVATAAYGPDWETRAVRNLAGAAVALASLFPLAAALLPSTGGGAAAGGGVAAGGAAGGAAASGGAGGAAHGAAASSGVASGGGAAGGGGATGAATGGGAASGSGAGGVATSGGAAHGATASGGAASSGGAGGGAVSGATASGSGSAGGTAASGGGASGGSSVAASAQPAGGTSGAGASATTGHASGAAGGTATSGGGTAAAAGASGAKVGAGVAIAAGVAGVALVVGGGAAVVSVTRDGAGADRPPATSSASARPVAAVIAEQRQTLNGGRIEVRAQYARLSGPVDAAVRQRADQALRAPLDWTIKRVQRHSDARCTPSSRVSMGVRVGVNGPSLVSVKYSNSSEMYDGSAGSCVRLDGKPPGWAVTVDLKSGRAYTAEDILKPETLTGSGIRTLLSRTTVIDRPPESAPHWGPEGCLPREYPDRSDFFPRRAEAPGLPDPYPPLVTVFLAADHIEVHTDDEGSGCSPEMRTAPYAKVRDLLNPAIVDQLPR